MNIKKSFGRLWINKSAIWKLSYKITGGVFTLWGLIGAAA